MRATYKYKVYTQNRNHTVRFDKQLSTACWVYNHCIALHKRYYSLYHKSLSANKLKVHLTKLKKQEKYQQWNKLSSQSIQQIAEKIDDGYKKFFKKQAKRPPTFRSWRKYKSITFKNTGWSLNGNEFVINSIGLRLRFHKSRELDGIIKTVTIKKDAVGDLWICFSLDNVQNQTQIQPKTGKAAGFDFGMKIFLTVSDGQEIASPQTLLQNLDKLRKVSNHFSRKRKGSASRKKAKLQLEKLHRKIANQREDFQWRMANDLVKKYDVLCFEDLNMKGMQMLWGRKISDLAFAAFMNKVEYLATKHEKVVKKVDRFYPSSKTCGYCGHVYKELTLKERSWTCPNCDTTHDRDLNAAKNILMVGTSTMEGGIIRPALAG